VTRERVCQNPLITLQDKQIASPPKSIRTRPRTERDKTPLGRNYPNGNRASTKIHNRGIAIWRPGPLLRGARNTHSLYDAQTGADCRCQSDLVPGSGKMSKSSYFGILISIQALHSERQVITQWYLSCRHRYHLGFCGIDRHWHALGL
jgi:hypothetical protein